MARGLRTPLLPAQPAVAELTAEIRHITVPPGAYGLADGETTIRTDADGNQFRVTATHEAIMRGRRRPARRK
jgi:hypothetical protein